MAMPNHKGQETGTGTILGQIAKARGFNGHVEPKRSEGNC